MLRHFVGDISDPEYYQPTDFTPYDFASSDSFDDYIKHTVRELKEHRFFIDPARAELELAHVSPYSHPATATSSKTTKGFIFVHGYVDTTHDLRDVADALHAPNHHQYGLLLPGHGTTPGDLLDVQKEHWLEAVKFAVRCMRKKTTDITLVGFSLGGLLSYITARQIPGVSRLILIAPVFRIFRSFLAAQTVWVQHIVKWCPASKPYFPVRYQTSTIPSIAQIYLASKQAQGLLSHGALTIPVFMALTAEDNVIDSEYAFQCLQKTMSHPKNRACIYRSAHDGNNDIYSSYENKGSKKSNDSIKIISTLNTDQKIINLSHVSLPYAPHNPVVGKDASSQSGIWYGETSSQTRRTLHHVTGSKSSRLNRLSYNPFFDTMMTQIKAFLSDTS